MIQRIQSLWLFLAAAAVFFVLKLPLAGGRRLDKSIDEVMASGNLLMFIVAILMGIISVVAIFMFKNRPNQKRLIWLGILLDIVFIVMMYFEMENFKNPALHTNLTAQTFKAGAIFPILYVILMVMAYSGVRHDEKLIKSIDRLR